MSAEAYIYLKDIDVTHFYNCYSFCFKKVMLLPDLDLSTKTKDTLANLQYNYLLSKIEGVEKILGKEVVLEEAK